MAFTKASQVADLIRSRVIPGVAVSIGTATGAAMEAVVKGYEHPPDGMSRRWRVDLLGPSGDLLDLTISSLRKSGFHFSGEAPIMRGSLTEALSKKEVAQLRASKRAKERQIDQQKNQAEAKAHAYAEAALVKSELSNKINKLEEELERLRESLDDVLLMPQPRGAQGPAGKDGKDGRDGEIAGLSDAKLQDVGDINNRVPEPGDVIMWNGSVWEPRAVASVAAGNFGGGGLPGHAPGDNLFYVAYNGRWVPLQVAWQMMLDGGNLDDGESDSLGNYQLDGGDVDNGTTEAGLPLETDPVNGGLFVCEDGELDIVVDDTPPNP